MTGLEISIDKVLPTVNRKQKELGMCTDGAAVNVKMHSLIREELGGHYQLILSPAHKIQLAMRLKILK